MQGNALASLAAVGTLASVGMLAAFVCCATDCTSAATAVALSTATVAQLFFLQQQQQQDHAVLPSYSNFSASPPLNVALVGVFWNPTGLRVGTVGPGGDAAGGCVVNGLLLLGTVVGHVGLCIFRSICLQGSAAIPSGGEDEWVPISLRPLRRSIALRLAMGELRFPAIPAAIMMALLPRFCHAATVAIRGVGPEEPQGAAAAAASQQLAAGFTFAAVTAFVAVSAVMATIGLRSSLREGETGESGVLQLPRLELADASEAVGIDAAEARNKVCVAAETSAALHAGARCTSSVRGGAGEEEEGASDEDCSLSQLRCVIAEQGLKVPLGEGATFTRRHIIRSDQVRVVSRSTIPVEGLMAVNRLCFGSGVWVDHRFCYASTRRFSPFFACCRPTRTWCVAVELLFAAITGIVAGWTPQPQPQPTEAIVVVTAPQSDSHGRAKAAILATLLVARLLLLLAARPLRSILLIAHEALQAALVAASVGCLCALEFSASDDFESRKMIFNAAFWSACGSIACVCLLSLLLLLLHVSGVLCDHCSCARTLVTTTVESLPPRRGVHSELHLRRRCSPEHPAGASTQDEPQSAANGRTCVSPQKHECLRTANPIRGPGAPAPRSARASLSAPAAAAVVPPPEEEDVLTEDGPLRPPAAVAASRELTAETLRAATNVDGEPHVSPAAATTRLAVAFAARRPNATGTRHALHPGRPWSPHHALGGRSRSAGRGTELHDVDGVPPAWLAIGKADADERDPDHIWNERVARQELREVKAAAVNPARIGRQVASLTQAKEHRRRGAARVEEVRGILALRASNPLGAVLQDYGRPTNAVAANNNTTAAAAAAAAVDAPARTRASQAAAAVQLAQTMRLPFSLSEPQSEHRFHQLGGTTLRSTAAAHEELLALVPSLGKVNYRGSAAAATPWRAICTPKPPSSPVREESALETVTPPRTHRQWREWAREALASATCPSEADARGHRAPYSPRSSWRQGGRGLGSPLIRAADERLAAPNAAAARFWPSLVNEHAAAARDDANRRAKHYIR